MTRRVQVAGPRGRGCEEGHAAPQLGETCILLNNPVAQRRLSQLFRRSGYDADAFIAAADDFANEIQTTQNASPEDLIVAFVASALVDLVHWGARAVFRESRLFLHWPAGSEEQSPEARMQMRRALERLRGAHPSYESEMTTDQAISLLESGQIRLVDASADAPEAREIWRNGITTWSMPYRSREGRSKRFVLLGERGGLSVPIGLLEIGDDAPHNPVRDRALGLTGDTALTFASGREIAYRLRAFRRALKPDDLPVNPQASLRDLERQVEQIAEAGRGRQGVGSEINYRKRLTYLARFVRAESALRRGETEGSGIAEGIRAIRDIAIPRVNTEMTICGALPPFGPLLAGKLVASMAAHPLVRGALDRPFGEISTALFQARHLSKLLPTYGALVITTKGLYSGHSAQYERVRMPGHHGPVPLRKIGQTMGQTTSHLGDRTMKLAVRSLLSESDRQVSREYGSGGGKRQRTLHQAAVHAGLPGQILYAFTSRPVYAVTLASNIPRILLAGDAPDWNIQPYRKELSGLSYEHDVLQIWRSQWLKTARRRAAT